MSEEIRIYCTRPAERKTRKEEQIYDLLEKLNIDFLRAEHSPAATMEDCRAVDEALGCAMCKNLFLQNRQGTEFYLLLVPAEKKFKTKELSPQLGVSRLSFGSPEQMAEYLHCTPGCASPLCLLFDRENKVRLLCDRDLTKKETIGCHPAVNTSSLAFKTALLFEKILPAIGKDVTYVSF